MASDKQYQYIADAVKEGAEIRLEQEPELKNLLRAIYCIKCEVAFLIGQEMDDYMDIFVDLQIAANKNMRTREMQALYYIKIGLENERNTNT